MSFSSFPFSLMSLFSSDDNFYDAPETLSIKTSQSSRPSPTTSSIVTESRHFPETNVNQNTGNIYTHVILYYIYISYMWANKQVTVHFYYY